MTVSDPVRTPRRAFWGDARFFLGILLIVASVAGVWLVVAAARNTVPVYAATRTIVPGEAISADDVRVVDVALGTLADRYLTPDALADGSVATRTIDEGELVPTAAIGTADSARTTSVVVRSAVDVPASVSAGTVVEVWSAPLLEQGRYDAPRILVADATVVSVTRDESMIGGGSAALELVIPRADVASTLAAMADDSALSVVPTAGAGS
ncbi:SAF domain-containing protein [Microbacterium sp. HD4P20]|uniref:SAF domain-containing protein n=1 Tax=Microbacterium sp. HD4P20 TaxID=2864874 RepID=UPI001C641241|nr:SAF domain-containing protein [Microbacterium sp. HD4P20]MCP2637469.1 SAF domain-containing protein [Microbacterium sp. HD4P20]